MKEGAKSMEQHQAVKPNINIERKGITGVVRFVIFLFGFLLILGVEQWLREHPPNTQNMDQEFNKILYDFEKDTETSEDRYIEITTQLK